MIECARLIGMLLLLASTIASAAEPRVRRNIPYANPGHDLQKLDVYAPTEGTGHPVVVWIHGGGWRRGDKAGVQLKPRAFVDQGYVFVSINYRFVPEVTLAEMTGDVAKAIRYVRDHVEKAGGDPKSIIVMGHSAGAHLAALVCTDPGYLKAEGLELSAIKGCVPVDTAVYDAARQLASVPAIRRATYSGPFGKDEATQRELSPVTHVAKDTGIPPFLILHVADRPDSTAQSKLFAEKLTAAGVRATTFAGEGKTHGTISTDLGKPDDPPTKAVFAFLSEVLKPPVTGDEPADE